MARDWQVINYELFFLRHATLISCTSASARNEIWTIIDTPIAANLNRIIVVILLLITQRVCWLLQVPLLSVLCQSVTVCL